MNPTDRTAPSRTETLTFEFDLHHPPEKGWRALTDPALLAEWLLPSVGFELAPGATFRFQAPPQRGWDGTVNCRILEIEAGQTLTWSWVVGDIDTVVTFTLEPTTMGTRLTVVHSGFKPDQRRNFAGARYGWRMMGGKLVDLLGRIE
jgi:uncharacterized protein YndB with AHSA1/START domain|nr:MAG: SRPBCC domain-containing protein [bacterium]